MSLETRFTRSFEEGVKGEFTDYVKWLTQFGFDAQKGLPLKGGLDVYSMNMFIDRDDEIEKIGKLAGFFSKETDVKVHVVLTAPTGYGKTSILKTIRNLLPKIAKEPVEFIESAAVFKEDDENGVSYLFRWLEKIKYHKKLFILIDHCEDDLLKMGDNISNILRDLGSVFLITTWSDSSWYTFRRTNPRIIEEFRHISITPRELGEKELAKLITDRLLYYKIDEKKDLLPFEEELIEEIISVGRNNPGFCLKIASDILEIGHKDELTLIGKEVLSKYVGKYRIEEALTFIKESDELKLNMLLWILRYSLLESRGINTETLSENIGRDRTTIIPHLKKMLDSNIVTCQKIGREVFYKINNFMLPLIETVMKERLE